MATIQTIITDAMGLINTIAIDETPPTSELNLGLRTLNYLIAEWSVQNLMLRGDTDVTVNTTAGISGYTIGPSGSDITGGKPIRLLSANVIDSQMDYPLEIIDMSVYESLIDKDVTQGRPYYVAYDPVTTQQATASGKFYLYPEPDAVYPVTFRYEAYLTEYTGLSNTSISEPIYEVALVQNLAVKLFRRYHDNKVVIPQDLMIAARNSENVIKSMNNRPGVASFDFPGKVSKYNIYTDQG